LTLTYEPTSAKVASLHSGNLRRQFLHPPRPGASVIKKLRLQVTTFCNKLERFSLASLSSLV